MKDINRENSMCIERYLDVRTRRRHRRRRRRHHVHLIEYITYRRDFSVVLDSHTPKKPHEPIILLPINAI